MIALFIVLGTLGASIILLRTSTYGVGIGSDETNYISMARNVADGNGFETYLGRYTANRPPLFPTLLAVGVLLGLDAPDAARFLNAATFGLIVCLSGLYLARRVESRLLALGVATALLVSPTLMSVSSVALTDGTFLLLVLLSLIALDGHLHGGRRSALVWAAVFAGLSVLTRYAGALVVAHGVLTLLLAGRNGRRGGIAIYVLVTGVPVSAWMLRNALTVGSVLGRWQLVDDPLTVTREFLHTLVDVMFHLYWGRHWIKQLLGDAGALILLILGLAVVSLGYAVVFRGCSEGFRRTGTKPVALFGTFFLVYVGGLILVFLLRFPSPQGGGAPPRYFMPSYVAFLFVTALLLDGLLRNPGTRGTCMRWVASAALAAALLNSILAAAVRSVNETTWMTANGSKFTSKRWHDRRTIRYIKTHAIDGCIVSNVPDAVYIHADVRPAAFGFLPRNGESRSRSIWDEPQFAERSCDVYLVWFDDEEWRKFSYGRREIESLPDAHFGPDAEVLLDAQDGMILRVRRS